MDRTPKRRYQVAPGATILLYTDGLVEKRGASIDDGLDRLVEAVSAGPDDPDALLAFIVAELVPEHQRLDDIAVIALKSSAAPTQSRATDRISMR